MFLGGSIALKVNKVSFKKNFYGIPIKPLVLGTGLITGGLIGLAINSYFKKSDYGLAVQRLSISTGLITIVLIEFAWAKRDWFIPQN